MGMLVRHTMLYLKSLGTLKFTTRHLGMSLTLIKFVKELFVVCQRRLTQTDHVMAVMSLTLLIKQDS